MEEEQQLKEIFQRYVNNECTEQEVKFLLAHFRTDDNEDTLRENIAAKLNEYPVGDFEQNLQSKPKFDVIFNSILDNIADEHEEEEAQLKKSGSLLIKLIGGIAVVFIGALAIYSYHSSIKVGVAVVKNIPAKTNITPGSNKAILTLQDGSTIVLNDAKEGTLAQQGNANIVKMANGQLVYNKTDTEPEKVLFNTMTTPRGGQYKLTLPDGTDVWLNSASSITYPTAFVGNERNVSVTGEAYFEVAKDKTKPFHVKAGSQTIEVLGTHFNVMAYADEDVIKTTLLEGSVKVTGDKESGILKPGEQSAINKAGDLKVSVASIDEAMAWKNGYFKFNRVGIKYIMRQLSRWYDVDVVYDGRVKEDEFVGTIGRGENIVQALHLLELANVHFKIQDKKIIVLP
ncbi:FecR family protein [Mucilaginibacter sp. UYCu711]|uniref:FecR family protein n=1 Tax=Mucilaginibacter sp. UYCu711 TaxID=3156339 RepID=UPI003D26285A